MTVNILHKNEIISHTEEDNILNALDLYPDESLRERDSFKTILKTKELRLNNDFMNESARIKIPWQWFCLSSSNLHNQIQPIKNRRKQKASFPIANRPSSERTVSTRMVDRILDVQEFLLNKQYVIERNGLIGRYVDSSYSELVQAIPRDLGIDMHYFRSRPSKGEALKYLIAQAEKHQFGVARIVYDHGLFPSIKQSKETFNKSSGFIVYDKKIPYIFLPAESGYSETPGRQIYSCFLLLAMAFKGAYNLMLTPHEEERYHQTDVEDEAGRVGMLYWVVNEILLPRAATSQFGKQNIDRGLVLRLASKYKLTPQAVYVILSKRGLIDDDQDIDLHKKSESKGGSSLSLVPAIQKFCGPLTSARLLKSLKGNALTSTDFEHLVCGRRNKSITSSLISEGVL